MSHYQQGLVLEAPPTAVYAALATLEGLRGWWTQDCGGAIEVGGTLHFRFGRNRKEMLIERLDPGREVRWRCTAAQMFFAATDIKRRDEWAGTQLVFRLTPDGEGRTRLYFEHVGLVPACECYGLCSNGWQYFLGSLRRLVETGRGTPYEMAAERAA